MPNVRKGSCHIPLAALLVSALSLAACGDGGPPATPSPQSTLPPSPGAGQPSPVPAERTIDLASEEAETVMWGADSGDFLNDLPALVGGDVNGDGVKDLLIGARFGDGPNNDRLDSGEAYVIFGSADLPKKVDLAAGQQDLTVYGAAGASAASANGDQLGFSATLADVNGDGTDDIILGAPFAQRADNEASAGIVYVLFGGPDLTGTIDLAEVGADITLLGAEGSAFFGDALATAEVNGDGNADIIVGAPFARRPADLEGAGMQAGAAYVVFGGQGLQDTRDMARQEYDVAVYGAEEFQGGDEAGDNVAGADINGDGVGDIIITAEAADGPDNARSVAAEVYVIYGSPGLAGVLDIAAGDQDVTVFGAEANDTIGFNIASGDINGDGVQDLLMTARLADGPGNAIGEAGEVHVVLGRDSLPQVIDLAADQSESYIFGPDPADQLGASLAAADLDGDGQAELLTGTPFADGPGNSRDDGGEAYVLDASALKGPVPLLSTPLKLVVYGSLPDDRLGAAMTAADLDDDGTPELIILAMDGDGPEGSRPDAGQLYILRLAP